MLMEKVRSVTKYFMWFAAIAFVLSMGIGFGANIFTGNTGDEENLIAKVSGETVTYKDYGDAIRGRLQDIGGALGSDPIKERQLSEAVVNQLVTDKIINDLLKKREISVSEDQIVELIRENPPAEIMQSPDFWVGEQFDYDRYFELLKDPRAAEFVRSYAAQLTQNLPMSVLRGEISSMSRITSGEAIENILEDSLKVRIEYIKLPLKEWESEQTSISLEEFYTEHQEMFRRDYLLKLGYVSFPISIDDETVQIAEELANSVVERAKTDSFDLLVGQYSYAPVRRQLLQGWVKVNNLTHGFAKTLAGMREGDVSKPIKSEDGFHILKLEDRQKDSVKVKEIFLPLFPSYDDFQKSSGEAWKLVKKLRSDSIGVLDDFEPEYISLGRGELPAIAVNFGTFLIDPEEGDISYPLIGEDAFYVFWIEEKEEGIPAFSEIEEEVRDSLIKYEAAVRAKHYALSQLYGSDKLPRRPEKGEWGRTPYFSLKTYGQFNIPRKVAYSALNIRKDGIFPPQRVDGFIYVVKQIDFKMPEMKDLKEQVLNSAVTLQKSKESSYFQKWFYHKRKEYCIHDLREKIYE